MICGCCPKVKRPKRIFGSMCKSYTKKRKYEDHLPKEIVEPVKFKKEDKTPEKQIELEQETFSPIFVDEDHFDIKDAKIFAENGDFDKAIRIYEKAIQHQGPSANIFYLLGNIFYEISETKNSIKMLKKALFLDPNFIEAINLLSHIYKELGDEDNFQTYTRRGKRVQQRLTQD